MKRILVSLFISFLVQSTVFGQLGYSVGSRFIKLNPDTTALVLVQQRKKISSRMKEYVGKRLQDVKRSAVYNRGKGRFMVEKSSVATDEGLYISHTYRTENNEYVIVLPTIIIKTEEGSSIGKVLHSFPSLSVERDSKGIYYLGCNVASSDEVLKIVRELSKQKDVVWCEPDMYFDFNFTNTLYPQQYYLENTGQTGGTYGMDINVVPAWGITTGSPDVTVAILDTGMDLYHEDFDNCILQGYTIGNATGYGTPQNYDNSNIYKCKGHGMACAGIVGATDNSIGIKGVASGVKLLPVNIAPNAVVLDYSGHPVDQGFGSNQEIATAIEWAADRADVLSCSWGSLSNSNVIEQAIQYARTSGRNGKGCVVVAASGNNGNKNLVSYPAAFDGVIAVGALDKDGCATTYSNGGSALSLMAFGGSSPGDIVTTDRMGANGYDSMSNYLTTFNGTSAACPQVSGVAALMLSVNPSLTEQQVHSILQQTARDLGTTGFDTTYGHGLVDAYAAVDAVVPKLSGSTYLCGEEVFQIQNYVGGMTVNWEMGDVYYANSSTRFKPNYPSAGECTIIPTPLHALDDTLTAYVYAGNTLLQTLKKHVTSSKQPISCQMSYSYSNSGTLPGVANTGDRIDIPTGCRVTLTSTNLQGMTVTKSGTTPSYWNFNGTNKISFELPESDDYQAIKIHGVNSSTCKVFDATFYNGIQPDPIVLDDEYSLRVTKSGTNLTVMLQSVGGIITPFSQGELNAIGDDFQWTIRVNKVSTGQQMYNQSVTGSTKVVSTSGWASGYYIVQAIVDGDVVATQKVLI